MTQQFNQSPPNNHDSTTPSQNFPLKTRNCLPHLYLSPRKISPPENRRRSLPQHAPSADVLYSPSHHLARARRCESATPKVCPGNAVAAPRLRGNGRKRGPRARARAQHQQQQKEHQRESRADPVERVYSTRSLGALRTTTGATLSDHHPP